MDHLPIYPRRDQHLGLRQRRRRLPPEQPNDVALEMGFRDLLHTHAGTGDAYHPGTLAGYEGAQGPTGGDSSGEARGEDEC